MALQNKAEAIAGAVVRMPQAKLQRMLAAVSVSVGAPAGFRVEAVRPRGLAVHLRGRARAAVNLSPSTIPQAEPSAVRLRDRVRAAVDLSPSTIPRAAPSAAEG